MKVVLTLDLQEDNNTSVLKGSQTKTSFVQTDYGLIVDFLVGPDLKALVEYMCWIAGPDGATPRVPKPANGSTCTISTLAVR